MEGLLEALFARDSDDCVEYVIASKQILHNFQQHYISHTDQIRSSGATTTEYQSWHVTSSEVGWDWLSKAICTRVDCSV